jgi:hypothetical protein
MSSGVRVLPAKSNQKWREVVTGKTRYAFEHLGLKILMTRIELQLMRDASNESVDKAVSDLHAFFQKFELVASEDLKKIFPEAKR